MAVVTIAFEDLDTWLQSQPVNTVDTPYELNVTGLTSSDIGDSEYNGTLGYILIENNTKYVDLTSTVLPRKEQISETFYNCTSLVKPPIITEGTRELHAVFSGCTSMNETPIIPNGVISLDGCFRNCTSLVEYPVIPKSVITISSAFAGMRLSYPPQLHNGIRVIDACFMNCINLTDAPIIPDSVQSMDWAFEGCSSLINVPTIPENVTGMIATFRNCTSLQRVPNIPKNVIFMYSCFEGCTTLEEITLFEADLESLVTNSQASNCFANCTSLTRIGVPPSDPPAETDWHCFRLKFGSNTVEGKVYDKTGTSTNIPQTSITKSTLKLPIKTDEVWFPSGYTDAEIDTIISKVLQYRYTYWNKDVLPPDDKNFILWADDPDNVKSNIKGINPVNVVQSGNMNSVTSNAVYQELLKKVPTETYIDLDLNSITTFGVYKIQTSNLTFEALHIPVSNWGVLIVLNAGGTVGQLYLPDTADTIYKRYLASGTWSAWTTFITSSNIGSQSVNYANSAGSAGSAGSTNAISFTGTGVSSVTAQQTADTYYGASGWASYLIFNHGDGSNYFHQMLRMPFWAGQVPQYQKMEGGVLSGWKNFITDENIGSQSVTRATYANGANTPFIINADTSVAGNYDEGIRINQNSHNGWATLLIGGDHGSTVGASGGFWFGVNRTAYGNKLFLNWNSSVQNSYFEANNDGTVKWVGIASVAEVANSANSISNQYIQPTAYAGGALSTKAFYFPAGTPESDAWNQIVGFCNYWIDNYYPVEWGYKNENNRIQAISRMWMNGSYNEIHLDDTGGGNVQSIHYGSSSTFPYPIVLRLTRLTPN